MSKGGVTKAKLKIPSLLQDLYNIDLQLQQIRLGQPNPYQIQTLEQAKFQIQ